MCLQDKSSLPKILLFIGVHEQITKDDQIRRQWNQGQVPKFPYYHNVETTNIKTNMEKKEDMLSKRTSELESLFIKLKNANIDTKDDVLSKRTSELEELFKDLKKKYRIDDDGE